MSSYLFAQLCFLSTPPPQFNKFPLWQRMRALLSACALQLSGGACGLGVYVCSLEDLWVHFSYMFSPCVCCAFGSAFLWPAAVVCGMGIFLWSCRTMLARSSCHLLAHLGMFSGFPLCNIRSAHSAFLRFLFMCLGTVSPEVPFLDRSVCAWVVCGHVLQCCVWVCQSLGFCVLSCLLLSASFLHWGSQAPSYHFEAWMRKLAPLAPSEPKWKKDKGMCCALGIEPCIHLCIPSSCVTVWDQSVGCLWCVRESL